MSQHRFGVPKLVGCSIRGPSHEEDETPCQDSYQAYRLPGGRFVIAVGDGLGSASRSHVGSDLATREAVDVLRTYLNGGKSIDRESAEKAVWEAVTAARARVFKRAEQTDISSGEFNTTLLVAIAGPSGVAGGAVGDGGIVTRHGDAVEKLIPREMEVVDIEYSTVTVPLLSDSWEDSYKFGFRDEVSEVAVFSDGIEEFAWNGFDPSSEYFEDFFDFLQSHSDTDYVAQEIANTLDNNHYRKYSGDDKTLIVGVVPSEPETLFDRLRTGREAASSLRGALDDSTVAILARLSSYTG